MNTESIGVEIYPDFSKDDFIRHVLIKLCSNPKMPKDISTVKFKEVKKYKAEVLSCLASVDGDYSVSVGYDRVEEYTETVPHTDSDGHTTFENETRHRTVIDWRPYNGHISGKDSTFIYNYNSPNNISFHNIDGSNLEMLYDYKPKLVAKPLNDSELSINDDALRLAKSEIVSKVLYSNRMPGDHIRDLSFNPNVTLDHYMFYILPVYEVEFTYKEYTFTATSFAINKLNARIKYPTEIKKEEVNHEIEADHKIHIAKIPGLLINLIGLYAFVTFDMDSFMNDFGLFLILLGLADMILCSVINMLWRWSRESQEEESHGSENAIVIKYLEASLVSRHYPSLTKKERSSVRKQEE